MKAEIYAANLHHGGGASGASTFLDDIPALHANGDLDGFDSLVVVASSLVASNMSRVETIEGLPNIRFEVRNDAPTLSALWARRKYSGLDAQLIVRGPHFAPLTATRTVLGFADGTLHFPRPRGVHEDARDRVSRLMRSPVKRRLIPRYDSYIVQTQRLAERLRREVGDKPILVVPNSPSPLFTGSESPPTFSLEGSGESTLRLFYPARGYAHKNHAIIGPAGRYLEKHYGVRLDVTVTLRHDEFARLPLEVQAYCTNVGEATLAECAIHYEAADGVLFASLNEVSSATPLEGMAMGRPVFASDRDFIREVAGSVPYYFDPLNAVSVAETIVSAFRDGHQLRERLVEGSAFVASLPTPFERAQAYIRALAGP